MEEQKKRPVLKMKPKDVWLMAYTEEGEVIFCLYNLATHYSAPGTKEVIQGMGYATDWAEWDVSGSFKKLIFEKVNEG